LEEQRSFGEGWLEDGSLEEVRRKFGRMRLEEGLKEVERCLTLGVVEERLGIGRSWRLVAGS